jgi:type I restriction enzyme R subunit
MTENPDVQPAVLRDFFDQAGPLLKLLQSVVGLAPELVESRFSSFAAQGLSARQTQFLRMLTQYISERGGIDVGRLYDEPFSRLADGGPEDIFTNDQADTLISIVNGFTTTPKDDITPL